MEGNAKDEPGNHGVEGEVMSELLKEFAQWIIDNCSEEPFGYCRECDGDALKGKHTVDCIVSKALAKQREIASVFERDRCHECGEPPAHEVLAALEAWFKAYPGTIPFLRELSRHPERHARRAAVSDLCTVVEDMHIKNVGTRTRPAIYAGSHSGGHMTEQQNKALLEKDPDYVTKLMTPANMPGKTDHTMRNALLFSNVLPCSMCGDSDAHVGSHTRLCDPCWELTKRLEDKRRVALLSLARVEIVPNDTVLRAPSEPTNRLLINGVDIGITIGAGQGIEKTIREALKLKVVKS